MMRLVLHTNVVVSGLVWNGIPRRLLEATRAKDVPLFTSTALIEELAITLSRSKFEAKIAASLFSLGQLIDLYVEQARIVVPFPTPRLAPDPDDDVVIGKALAAKADLLVTGDHALLSVSTFEGGRIVSVQEALRCIQVG
jgi:putative PIN family toxin of toxin-antitoxin system